MPAPLHHSTTENEHETLHDHKLNLNLELHRRPVHFGPDSRHGKQKYHLSSAFWQEDHRHAAPYPSHQVR